MASNAKRVALLARPGAAGQRLADVLGEAGVDLVLQADPTQVEAASVLAARPDTLLVALDAPTEDALDRLEAALHAPAVDVIYEEAALIVAREGWDAARWRRHLLAKLLGHDNVLPPSQGAGGVPVTAPGREVASVASAADTPVPAAVAEQAPTTFSSSQTFDIVAEPVRDTAQATPAVDRPSEVAPSAFASSMAWTLDPGPGDAPDAVDVPDGDGTGAEPEPVGGTSELALSMEHAPPAAYVEGPDATVDTGIAAFDFGAFDPVAAETSDTAPTPTLAERWAEQAFVTEPDALASTTEDRFNSDLASLELRIASMSLVDETPVRGPEKVRGAVLVLAGIGGPDAVRQLLGSLPTDFVRPVLVQQRLDGARHDRLVAQMQRATTLPVKLAEAGQPVEQGTIYIVPDLIGVQEGGSGLVFQDGANDILAVLPAADSAVLMLSGSDPGRVDAALNFGWSGGFVVGQNVDGCYDAAAVTDLAARGGTVAKPIEMGPRLVAHWQRGG
jgi:chemosensory pili system protein ChpB (putative protein-glutamate methylesterase)